MRPHQVKCRQRSTRIGVVGAGVSGLTVAHHLHRAGYEQVTVLEKESRVGGKCCSVPLGDHVYEMGAVFGCSDYSKTRELMRRVGVQPAAMAGGHCYDVDGHPINLFTGRQYPRMIRQLVTYAYLTRVRYRSVNAPGLAGVDPDLHAPFAQFCADHGLPALETLVGPPFTAFGYGYLGEVPAAYVLKYLDLRTLAAMRDADHLLWYQRWADEPLDTLYALGDPSMTEEAVAEFFVEDLARMGATLDRVVAVRRWKYFPHVSAADMAGGYYEQVEGLQGGNHTYYAGEVMSFSSVELCARYSQDLVQRFFN